MTEFEIATYLGIAVITQCFFSILYLSSYRWHRNRWLVVVFVALMLTQAGLTFSSGNLPMSSKILVGNPALLLLIWPSLYFYTLALVDAEFPELKRFYLHFTPFVLFYFLFLWIVVEPPDKFVDSISRGHDMPYHLTYLAVFLGTSLYYGLASLRLIDKNQQKYKDEYAESNIYLTLNWLKYICWIVLGLISLGTLMLLSSNIFMSLRISYVVILVGFLLVSMLISYFSFRQPTIYKGKPELRTGNAQQQDFTIKNTATPSSKEISSKPLLTAEQITELNIKIDALMEQQQPYLNPSIKMPAIAKQLDISSNTLSWYLNEHQQLNFFTFINRYRITHAIGLINDPDKQHYTLEALSQEAGFKSKTTFNSRFKEVTGKTPSAYRRVHK